MRIIVEDLKEDFPRELVKELKEKGVEAKIEGKDVVVDESLVSRRYLRTLVKKLLAKRKLYDDFRVLGDGENLIVRERRLKRIKGKYEEEEES